MVITSATRPAYRRDPATGKRVPAGRVKGAPLAPPAGTTPARVARGSAAALPQTATPSVGPAHPPL
jgi:hypothetical protein